MHRLYKNEKKYKTLFQILCNKKRSIVREFFNEVLKNIPKGLKQSEKTFERFWDILEKMFFSTTFIKLTVIHPPSTIYHPPPTSITTQPCVKRKLVIQKGLERVFEMKKTFTGRWFKTERESDGEPIGDHLRMNPSRWIKICGSKKFDLILHY